MDTFSRGSFGRFTLHHNECYSYLYLERERKRERERERKREREREREREKKLVFKQIPKNH